MSGGLFGDAFMGQPAAAGTEKTEKTEKTERRVKLFPYDHVASQLFEPFQESVLDTLSVAEVWAGAAKGNRKAAYHSHLCADLQTDAWHVGAGVSQTAEILLAAIKNWKKDDMQRLVKEELRDKVNEEVAVLEPILEKLNVGRGSQQGRDTGSYRQAKKQRFSGTVSQPATEDEVIQATQALHRWLSQERSAFRSLLFILAGNGTYYAARAAEVVARGAVHYKPLSSDNMVTAMRARMSKPAESATPNATGSSDANGLFN